MRVPDKADWGGQTYFDYGFSSWCLKQKRLRGKLQPRPYIDSGLGRCPFSHVTSSGNFRVENVSLGMALFSLAKRFQLEEGL